MSKRGKNYLQTKAQVDVQQDYELAEAIDLLKQSARANFDETAEIAFRLGVDPTKSDQMVRGTLSLPHGTGKTVRVVVFATGEGVEAAREAGADEAGFEDLVQRVRNGWTDFDVAIATPEAMSEVRKLGRVLGPRGLMPNPKTGTVTDNVGDAVREFKGGRLSFKMDRRGNVHIPFGKVSFEKEALLENCRAAIQAVSAARPDATKGIFIRRCTISTTMGPGIRVNHREALQEQAA